jgi:hypothetical protein
MRLSAAEVCRLRTTKGSLNFIEFSGLLVYLYERDKVMVSNLEDLSDALTRGSNRVSDEARSLSEKIKSSEKIQSDLEQNGVAYFRDSGRDFVVRRKGRAAGE